MGVVWRIQGQKEERRGLTHGCNVLLGDYVWMGAKVNV